MEDKEILLFLAQAADAFPAQSTQGMKVKAKALQWLSASLEHNPPVEDKE